MSALAMRHVVFVLGAFTMAFIFSQAATVNMIKCSSTTTCPDNSTCCKLSTGEFGCCPHVNATCCSDGIHCCPVNTTCSKDSSSCIPKDVFASVSASPSLKKFPASNLIPSPSHDEANSTINGDIEVVICPDQKSECLTGQTCCMLTTGQYGCCPIPNAVCCDDHEYCCPENNYCDTVDKTCVRRADGFITPMIHKIPAMRAGSAVRSKMTKLRQMRLKKMMSKRKTTTAALSWTAVKKQGFMDVICPDKSLCQDGATCCPSSDGGYGCCPLSSALCCADGIHCCPQGYSCGIDGCYPVASSKSKLYHDEDDADDADDDDDDDDDDADDDSSLEHAVKDLNDDIQVDQVQSFSTIESSSSSSLKKMHIDVKKLECQDGSSCVEGSTCCRGQFGEYGCCPLKDAVCCKDGLHCCPVHTKCDDVEKKCISLFHYDV